MINRHKYIIHPVVHTYPSPYRDVLPNNSPNQNLGTEAYQCCLRYWKIGGHGRKGPRPTGCYWERVRGCLAWSRYVYRLICQPKNWHTQSPSLMTWQLFSRLSTHRGCPERSSETTSSSTLTLSRMGLVGCGSILRNRCCSRTRVAESPCGIFHWVWDWCRMFVPTFFRQLRHSCGIHRQKSSSALGLWIQRSTRSTEAPDSTSTWLHSRWALRTNLIFPADAFLGQRQGWALTVFQHSGWPNVDAELAKYLSLCLLQSFPSPYGPLWAAIIAPGHALGNDITLVWQQQFRLGFLGGMDICLSRRHYLW